MVGTMEQPSIIAIDKVSVARICSGQVITDLATAVKELVENSLDAGAKHVEVKLKEFGLDSIEVSDNGSGVSPSNYEGLALKYHTSKLSTFSDLSGVRSFGFRGEALSSLCELAGSFSVTTRTAGESVGVKLTYGRDGKLLGKETAPRQMGTTVSISNMFQPLPVRRGEFKRNIKKQYNRLLRGMQAYALISLGARITVTNTKAKGGKQTLIGTQYNNKLGDNVTNVFGAKFLSTLSPVDICLDDKGKEGDNDNSEQGEATPTGTPLVGQEEAASSAPRKAESSSKRRIWGMVSKAGEGVGRSDNDRQFLYLNGRPVDMPKFSRAVSEVWRAYEMKQKPAFVLDVRLPPGSFDVNVTPDKREIFMTEESEMVDRLKKALHELWAPSRYTIPVNQGQLTQARLTDKAFTLQDAPVKSPPAPAVGGTSSRLGIVSPEALNDLAAVDATTAEHDDDDVLPVSKRARGSKASKRAAGGGGGGERLMEEPRDDGDAETNVRGAEVEGEGETESSESASGGGVDGPDVVPAPKGSPQQPRREDSSGASSRDALPLSTADGQGQVQEQTPKRSSTKKRRSSESSGSSKPVAGVVIDASQDAATGDGRGETEGGEDPPGQGELKSEGERSPRANNRGDGATTRGGINGGSSRAEAMTPEGVDAATASPAQEVTGGARNERMAAGIAPGASLAFDMQSILGGCRKASRLKRKRDERNASAHSFSGKLSGGGAELQDSKAAERAFSRVLNKEHFTQMRVVGQFNLGFAICLLGSDLFILDQHACDEKYNFEVLQETTTIHQQPLVRPLPLETTASEEMSIIDNMAIFEKNGFRFTVDDDQPTTKKLKITAIPFSKGTQFGVDDVHELASIVAENNSPGEMVRLPKARAMFASRACRSSIMIGKALDRGQMERVVAKMATIEQPWNCPHGRPTMRHLADVSKSLRTAAGLDPLLEG